MNPTRTFLLHRAAAVAAQLQDPGPRLGAMERNLLRLEYRDLRCALTRIHRAESSAADDGRVLLPESLWMQHCEATGLNPEHDAFHL